MNNYYNLANIRILLMKSSNQDELLNLCFDVVRPVYDNWSRENTKSDLVRSIIDYAFRQVQVEAVLNWVKDANPERYKSHQPYINDELFSQTETQAPIVSILPDNYIGNGLTIGGEYLDSSLRIAATEWTDYGTDRQIRSGWLFLPQWTANHAITFFKVHVLDNSKGYIHFVDTTDPEHTVYLVTDIGFRREGLFHYLTNPSDVWEFILKQ